MGGQLILWLAEAIDARNRVDIILLGTCKLSLGSSVSEEFVNTRQRATHKMDVIPPEARQPRR